jgi:hypothetical protein
MTGIELMRDAALLGAECALATPADQLPRAERGFEVLAEARAEARSRLHVFAASDDALWSNLRTRHGLSVEASFLTLLCAAVELHPEAAAAASILAEDRRMQLVTPLVFARLARSILDLDYVDSLTAALEGGVAQLAGLIEVLEPVSGLPRSQQALRLRAGALPALLMQRGSLTRTPALTYQLPATSVYAEPLLRGALMLLRECGRLDLRAEARRAARQFACDLGSLLGEGCALVTLDETLPPSAQLARRERGLLALDLHAWPKARPLPLGFLDEAAEMSPLVVLLPAWCEGSATPLLDVASFDSAAARRAWASELNGEGAHQLSIRFRFSVEEVRATLREARDLARVQGIEGPPPLEIIEARARAQGARRMGQKVTVIEPTARLADLVVPGDLREQLADAVAWYRASARVFEEMGVGARSTLARGLTCLFSGKPGTGKSLAAQCLAGELGLNVYRIDLSQVVSKYIGETEKELAQIFDEADAGHGVLVFDEADALFGRRSEVKDARDRYANIEVGYLLQRLERFEGVAILTTNLRGNMDAAFMRRLRFVLEFPMPDKALRRHLWERSLPTAHFRAPDLELDVFAERFALSGGNIENIGVAAAHLAAATPSGVLGNTHLVRATARELEKTGRPCSASSFGPLGHLLTETRL